MKNITDPGPRIPDPGLSPSLSAAQAQASLNRIYNEHIDAEIFNHDIRKLQQMFHAFTAYAPPPWPASDLKLTPEIIYQSELWLPIEQIRPAFYRLYRSTLRYPPVYSSTPFSRASSWAAVAAILSLLLNDAELRRKFICWSFMPLRFYGRLSGRYPHQREIISRLASQLRDDFGRISCLDAACGDGAGTYSLANTLLALMPAADFCIEGWTLDPLEVWSAAYATFPHAPEKEREFRAWVEPVYRHHAATNICFRQADLLLSEKDEARFHLIICNGLLGGPIVKEMQQIEQIAAKLAALLLPGGYLIIDDNFHGGWEKKIPDTLVWRILEAKQLHASRDGSAIICRKER